MGLVSLLFSVRGRINRTQYWAGSVGVYVGMWIALFLVVFMTASSLPKGTGKEGAFVVLISLVLAAIPIFGVAFWCQLALQIKRFHDRGRSWWFAMIPFAVIAPAYLAMFAAIGEHASPESVTAGMGPYMLVLMGVSVWLFIDLGCLPGVDGPNRFGDPPGGSRSRPLEPAPQPRAPSSATASIFGAQAAMDRAIAERAAQVQRKPAAAVAAPATRAPMPATATSGAAPSFGRRAPS